jgi:hypothetical protein
LFDLALRQQPLRSALERIASDPVGIPAHSFGAAVVLRVAAADRRVV